ncbi:MULTISPECIES: multidrug effflux MFS transporter [unclassified Pseudomonas]|uniref:multidrug effflux MFS transporter n=1 Tax=unclassified Pseudomonas TaxID=196821 RepID=UPI001F3AB131|nr:MULTISPECIES: multidrug effflux MFS transporter [unclassified Pseudomonas]MCF5231629.1 Bcr/CflA family efflux MFS transporter [Pseudomonas sp. PA-5-4H]MCF5237807.1 Bcr/CflA family efflux MFS transporter [Pseudomonas sp. PA-5-4G]MCF5248742.1 Bcr/CflA family efflux MFS transporter [Pseudomonas sp. PA-5-4B]MCF5256169.1 Bcr/CflA family efflux MFS transporter [Pseudomonas sp. PA-5-4B]MCF5260934.1 Bcr/CflA family efflux MFS transporter [Pseudomonas sp. PA-5-4A]
MTQRALSTRFWLVLLTVLIALPRLTLDLHLPALPAMADYFHSSDSQLQLTLTLYTLGSAISLLVSGPLTDRFGRRPVLLAGLLLYVVATVTCAQANSLGVLVIARLFQALGGCCTTVIGRVIVRDYFDRHEQARLLGLISMAMAISPMAAPVLGSLMLPLINWRGLFVLLAVIGAVLCLVVYRRLPETRPTEVAAAPPSNLLRVYGQLLRDRYFLRYALAIGCVYSTYFPFISESSSLLQRGYQLTATEYALVFAATISGYMLGANLFRRLVLRFEPDRLINAGIGLNVLGSFLLAMATLALPGEWLAIVLPMVVIMVSVGMVIPACQLSVLQPYGAIAGTASGLFFFIQMILTAVSSWVTGLLSDGTSLPLVIMTAAASALLITSWLTLHKTKCGSGGATTRLTRDSGVSVR